MHLALYDMLHALPPFSLVQLSVEYRIDPGHCRRGPISYKLLDVVNNEWCCWRISTFRIFLKPFDRTYRYTTLRT